PIFLIFNFTFLLSFSKSPPEIYFPSLCFHTSTHLLHPPYPSAFAPLWKQPKKVEAKSASTYSKRLSFTVTYSSLP
ncbi:hypothetical protein ACCH11_20185, partial [Bacteroides uniformis]